MKILQKEYSNIWRVFQFSRQWPVKNCFLFIPLWPPCFVFVFLGNITNILILLMCQTREQIWRINFVKYKSGFLLQDSWCGLEQKRHIASWLAESPIPQNEQTFKTELDRSEVEIVTVPILETSLKYKKNKLQSYMILYQR